MVVALIGGFAIPGCASPVYQGIYIEVNPYSNAQSTSDLQSLANAAGVACDGVVRPDNEFCNVDGKEITNGVLLQIPWCNWEPDATANSCLYLVNTDGSKAGVSIAGNTSPCAATGSTYDDCGPTSIVAPCALGTTPPQTWSILAQAMFYICQIDKQRAANSYNGVAKKLNPLKISLALEGGLTTPAHVQNTISAGGGQATIDVPLTSGNNYVCGRLPQVWLGNYTADYNVAFTHLINFLGTINNFPGGPIVSIAKVGGLNTDSAEIVLSGTGLLPGTIRGGTPPNWVADTTGMGAGISCTYLNASGSTPGTTPAARWLSLYGQSTHANVTFAQSIENTLGSLLGYEGGAMTAASQATPTHVSANFLFSMPTRNSQAFPDLNCGLNNALPPNCVVDDPYLSGTQWSSLYLVEAVLGLASTTSGSGKFAQQAWSGFSTTFQFNNVGLNSTNLYPVQPTVTVAGPGPNMPPLTVPNTTPVPTNCIQTNTSCQSVSDNQIPCNLNNQTASADFGKFKIGYDSGTGMDINDTITGPGTLVGAQTAPKAASGDNCSRATGTSVYDTTLLLGTNNGAQYLEVSFAEASKGDCHAPLADALARVLATALNAKCSYITQ